MADKINVQTRMAQLLHNGGTYRWGSAWWNFLKGNEYDILAAWAAWPFVQPCHVEVLQDSMSCTPSATTNTPCWIRPNNTATSRLSCQLKLHESMDNITVKNNGRWALIFSLSEAVCQSKIIFRSHKLQLKFRNSSAKSTEKPELKWADEKNSHPVTRTNRWPFGRG